MLEKETKRHRWGVLNKRNPNMQTHWNSYSRRNHPSDRENSTELRWPAEKDGTVRQWMRKRRLDPKRPERTNIKTSFCLKTSLDDSFFFIGRRWRNDIDIAVSKIIKEVMTVMTKMKSLRMISIVCGYQNVRWYSFSNTWRRSGPDCLEMLL